jgi:hypothetical protein
MLRLYNDQRCVLLYKPPAGLNPAGGYELTRVSTPGI